MQKYKKVKTIGKGSFGYAVLVKNIEEADCLNVMKIIDIEKMTQKQREESLTEIRCLRSMDHPFIIQYRESFIEKKALCIVMDYADGGDLYTMINEYKSKKLSIDEEIVVKIFSQICLAIEHVHLQKILHRDLKTQNIFLMKFLQVKLGDFGIAKILHHTYDVAKTAIGTPYYLSPEICQDLPYNNKSDIWSLGCILYEMLTLNHAFDALSMKGLVLKILQGSFPDPPSHYSKEIVSLLKALLQTGPEMRPSMDQILTHPAIADEVKKLQKQFHLVSPKTNRTKKEESSLTTLSNNKKPEKELKKEQSTVFEKSKRDATPTFQKSSVNLVEQKMENIEIKKPEPKQSNLENRSSGLLNSNTKNRDDVIIYDSMNKNQAQTKKQDQDLKAIMGSESAKQQEQDKLNNRSEYFKQVEFPKKSSVLVSPIDNNKASPNKRTKESPNKQVDYKSIEATNKSPINNPLKIQTPVPSNFYSVETPKITSISHVTTDRNKDSKKSSKLFPKITSDESYTLINRTVDVSINDNSKSSKLKASKTLIEESKKHLMNKLVTPNLENDRKEQLGDVSKSSYHKILRGSKDESNKSLNVSKTDLKNKGDEGKTRSRGIEGSISKSPVKSLATIGNKKQKLVSINDVSHNAGSPPNEYQKPKGSEQRIFKNEIKSTLGIKDGMEAQGIKVPENFQSNCLSKISTNENYNEGENKYYQSKPKGEELKSFLSWQKESSMSENVEKKFEEEEFKMEKKSSFICDPPLKSDFLFANLPITVDKTDTVSYKVEALRVYLESVVGLDILLNMYEGIKSNPDSIQTNEEENKYLPLVNQLIFLEERIFVNV